ncbi:LysM peptidoglycan-binding domain-containing protein [Desulfatitalea alkaliphila]|uniref:LysM peptidoglycan-binding domain-containing protein n=1 Tax=Desulfatitalea alkaliphila TaxID=2929485 RepID=A0AA41R5Y5_9BACT|nr:LysM domain-containing protein [Desulfatitalea alkaliphila]MCJ8502083.1 LysM peptidoglycan-binding domain-containing protein [Desulfatitalea alkaliphila]
MSFDPTPNTLNTGSKMRRIALLLLCCAFTWSAPMDDAAASGLVYKNYIVRYDRGWDILCEPYVVQAGDWVLKIFRQKGEIAHHDFRDFLGIFERLNPHVRDIDMIRPGQTIDIPLRKLEHGTLPGQASGVITIPFVTLAKVEEVIHQHAEHYQVRRGDTVSQLISARYGRVGTRAYQEGIKLFQAANPQVTDLDLIYAGQRLYLPDPSMRDEAWYADMFDEAGNLKETLDADSTRASAAAPLRPGAEPLAQAPGDGSPEGVLAQAAAVVGGELRDRGTYFLPEGPAGRDFEVDLSRHPLMEMSAEKLLFTQDGTIMDRNAALVQSQWPDTKVIAYDAQSSVPAVVGAIFEAIQQPVDTGEEVGFEDQGVQVTVRAKWIKPQRDQRRLCISPIAGPAEQTPVPLRRYLEQNGIVLKELLPGGEEDGATTAPAERHAVRDVLTLIPMGQKDFVQRLTRALGYSFVPNVAISFPYAGIQIQAYANLVNSPDGREVLVDFGELYGDAVKAIRQSGLHVVQIAPEADYTTIAAQLLAALETPFLEQPSFAGAQRPPTYNTTVTIQGLLVDDPATAKRTLLAPFSLHSAITDLIGANGVAVVTW